MAVRVLLAEDHGLVRAGLCLLLGQMEGVEVVGEASDGAEALQLIAAHQPDIALLDIAMAQINGLEVAARLRDTLPDVRVIMLSMHANEGYVRQALQSGAAGYLLKDAAPVELALAIAAVARGETYLSPAVAKHVVDGYVRRAGDGQGGALDRLTPRQHEILRLIAEGHTLQEIARRLAISVKTVEGHRAQLMERLAIHDVPGLVRFAIRTGLIAPDMP